MPEYFSNSFVVMVPARSFRRLHNPQWQFLTLSAVKESLGWYDG